MLTKRINFRDDSLSTEVNESLQVLFCLNMGPLIRFYGGRVEKHRCPDQNTKVFDKMIVKVVPG